MASGAVGVPELPHVMFNMTPLDVVLKRTALDAFKQLKEYIQYLENVGATQDTASKVHFLEMLVVMRERFVKLYVLCKWSRNNEAIGKLIDIFAWLREQNQMISGSILQFGELKGSLMAAKMLEPDLSTAMEVFSDGRPDLPTYNYLPRDPLDPQFVSKIMKNLNVELSIKMALQVNLPAQFLNYDIKDGRVNFNIINHFKFSISMLKDEKFNLIDFKFGFQLINNKIVSDVQNLEPQALINLQNIANNKLVDNNNNLQELFEFLFDYSATFKLQLIHKQMVNLKMSLWRGHLSHTYDSDNRIIKVTYWTQRKFVKPSYIEIGLFNNNKLSFKWFKNSEEMVLEDGFDLLQVEGVIDLEKVLNELIKRHIEIDINGIKTKLVTAVSQLDRALNVLPPNNDKLLFKITQSREVIYGIDKLSGSPYFENPTLLMNNIGFKMNSSNSLDYIELLRLKLEFQCNKIRQMMMATGWIPIDNVHILKEERLKLGIDYSDLNGVIDGEDLTNIRVYRRKDWQNGWFLLIGTFGWKSNIQIWCGRIECIQGNWRLNWVDEVNFQKSEDLNKELDDIKQLINLEVIKFNDLVELVKVSSSKLISNLVINEFEQQGCTLKVLNLSDDKVDKFLKDNFQFDLNGNDTKDSDNAVVLIKNDSWMKIQNCQESLVLIITVKNSKLTATLYGKIVKFDKLPTIEFENEKAKLVYSSGTKLFRVDSIVDLATKLTPTLPGSVDSTNESNDLEKISDDQLILSNVSELLDQFSRLLNLLQMINRDPSLNITNAELDCVGFSYGDDKDEWVRLKLNQSNRGLSVELPASNPHNVCLKYLNGLINSGESNGVDGFNCMLIKQLVIYLKLTLKFYKSYQKLMDEQLVKFEVSATNIIDYGFVLSLRGLENFSISYFKDTRDNGKDLRLDLNVDIKHKTRKLSLTDSLFMISIGDLRGGNVNLIKNVRQTIERVFHGEEKFLISGGKVLTLRDSLCCDNGTISPVLEFIHSTICKVLEL